MARLPALPVTDLPVDLHDTLAQVHDTYGFVPNSMLTMGHNPALLSAFSALGRAVMGEGSSIPGELRWLVAHLASTAAGCRYCMAHTGHNGGVAAGLDEDKAAAAWDFERSPLFTDAERAAMRLAVAAGGVPNSATDEMFDDLRAQFTDRQVADIVAVISFFGFLNRWNDTMATELEEAPLDFGTRRLAGTGWEAGKHAAL